MAAKRRRSAFGPGFLVAAAFIGPGTITTCTLAGAGFGYSLLFALVFATATTILLQEMTGRLSLGSGCDLAEALRSFPQKSLVRFLFIILTLSAITLGCAAYEAGNIIGGSLGLSMLIPVPQKVWVILIAAGAALLLSRGRYRLVEHVLIGLVFLMSLAFLTTMIIVKPDLAGIFRGLAPSFPDGSLLIVLALVGTTVVPYNLFLHSAAVKQKWNSREELGEVNRDLAVSIILGGILSSAVVVTSAAAFFGREIPIETGAQMARQLRPLFGGFANVLFGLGFFAAGLSSAITAPYAAAFASAGVLGWKKGSASRGFKIVWLSVIVAGAIVSLFNLNPLSVIVFAQVANGLVLPVASVFLLIMLNNRKRMGDLTNGPIRNVLGLIIILVVSFLGIWNIIKVFLK